MAPAGCLDAVVAKHGELTEKLASKMQDAAKLPQRSAYTMHTCKPAPLFLVMLLWPRLSPYNTLIATIVLHKMFTSAPRSQPRRSHQQLVAC